MNNIKYKTCTFKRRFLSDCPQLLSAWSWVMFAKQPSRWKRLKNGNVLEQIQTFCFSQNLSESSQLTNFNIPFQQVPDRPQLGPGIGLSQLFSSSMKLRTNKLERALPARLSRIVQNLQIRPEPDMGKIEMFPLSSPLNWAEQIFFSLHTIPILFSLFKLKMDEIGMT
jgi:hypothetical protein